MARIAFYLDTRRVRSADLRDVEAGNPGVGGTEYMFFLVAAALARIHPVSMYVTVPGRYPPGVRYVVVRDFRHAAVVMESAAEDVLIIRENEVLALEGLLNAIPQRIVVWAHNFSKRDTLRACARCPRVARYLCVSHEQLAMLGADPVVQKADYVYNGVVTRPYPTDLPTPVGDDVVYMGSLVRSKGFHVLARHWDAIRRQVPTARLHVVGSGRLYDEDAALGPLGLASADYEREFVDYVTQDGRLRPDIVFHGVLGAGKWRLLRQAKVAVANPTGVGETFCITAVEFGLLGVPVVTRRYGGPKDVIEDGASGLLFDDPGELAAAVVELLQDESRRREMGRRAMALTRARFDLEVVLGEWRRVLDEVLDGRPVAGRPDETPQVDAQSARDCHRLRTAPRRAAAAVIRAYVRRSPVRAGKAWLWERLLERGLRWRVQDDGRVLRTRFGVRLRVAAPGLIENAIDLTGRWEPQLSACLSRLLAAGDTFVDLGAGFGYHALLASRRVGGAGRVYACEADAATFERLEQNIRLNRAIDVHAFRERLDDGTEATARARLLAHVPEEVLFGARLIRIDTLRTGIQVLKALEPSLPRFSGRTTWLVTCSPSAQIEAPGEVDDLFASFARLGYEAFEVLDRCDPRGALARPASPQLRRLTRPPEACASVLFSRPGTLEGTGSA